MGLPTKIAPKWPVFPKRVKVAGLVVVAVVLLAASELGLRIHYYEKFGVGALESQALRDRFTAWRNNPAHAGHNPQGFRRNTRVAVPKPPNTIRIFLLGGSALYGAGGSYPQIDNSYPLLRDDELIDFYLERKLNHDIPGKHWEVINAASSGYRIHQQLALIESVILRYQPDLVFTMDGYNDAITVFNHLRQGDIADFDVYATTPDGDDFDALANPGSLNSLYVFTRYWLRSNSATIRILQDRLFDVALDRWRRQSANRQADLRMQSLVPIAVQKVSYFTAIARMINSVLKVSGIPFVFLLQPELVLSHKPLTRAEQELARYDREIGGPLYVDCIERVHAEMARSMKTAADEDGYTFVNLLDAFDETSDQVFTDFAHLTPRGNKIIAERLYEMVRATLSE